MTLDVKKQLPGAVQTSNEAFFDAMLRHQIGLLRLSGSIRNQIFRLLDATEADMAAKIRRALAGNTGVNTPADVRRLQRLLKSLKATRKPAWKQVTGTWVNELTELANDEPVTVDGLVKDSSVVQLSTTLPDPTRLLNIAQSTPFEGKTLKQWARNVQSSDLRRIGDQVKIGMVQGESSAAIARRVVGTRLTGGRNGATEITRRQADAITRTAVNGISNQAKQEYYKANDDILEEELYTATLDGRTTPICRSLDGEIFKVGVGPVPPLHFNCRSVRVAVFDQEVLGTRPAKPVTEKQLLREYTKANGLSPVASRADLPRGHKTSFDTFSRGRIRELTGTVPAKVTYQEWLSRQSAEFQDDVLGPTRGKMFRQGNLTLDQFVDRQTGRQFTLAELNARGGAPSSTGGGEFGGGSAPRPSRSPQPRVKWDRTTAGTGWDAEQLGLVPVNVSLPKLHAAWKRDGLFIETDTSSFKQQRFKEFVKAGNKVSMPILGLKRGGPQPVVGVDDGRNRLATLQGLGVKTMPIAVSRSEVKEFQRLFGVGKDRVKVPKGPQPPANIGSFPDDSTDLNHARAFKSAGGDKLTKGETDALTRYTGEPAEPINTLLWERKGKLAGAKRAVNDFEVEGPFGPVKVTPDNVKDIQSLDRAFSKISLDDDLVVWRALPGEIFDDFRKNLDGSKFMKSFGFTSTSTTRGQAEVFQFGRDDGMLKILAPKGSKALPIAHLSDIERQKEVLLNRGIRFQPLSWDAEKRELTVLLVN